MGKDIAAANVRLKRAYEAPLADDGQRILVDRLWPRGLSKAKARIDAWMKDVAPSTDLRKWFQHDPALWAEFQRRYRHGLAGNTDDLATLRRLAGEGPITLIYSARDEEHNDALVLREVILGRPA